ncbi:ABC transporter permease [Leifsonia sp. Root112D2]|jgi:peptide/nickel transport system permease protein|uniref:ABC transporter permease n=1 Tax=Leifsonia sp. Root112D2 TaxID=1736426 RepID=UPI000701CC34|nr:ABC transporter permease [Leifsonia sp. Root112D2]KQV07547.1 ABC transporter permease [Leifsonia sp. Root112D2]
MLSFILRRLGIGLVVLVVASYLMYLLTAYSGDPLADLRASTAPNKVQLMEARSQLLNLDVPPYLRYFIWLGGVLKVFIGQFTLGVDPTNAQVTTQLGAAMTSTLQLITLSEFIGLFIGVVIGITTALRQYSGYDYSVTFMSFLFFSLPVFWLAAMLKQYVAIGFNDFLGDPQIPIPLIIALAAISAFLWQGIVGGPWRKRLVTAGVSGIATLAILWYLVSSDWFSNPSLGPVVCAGMGVGIAFIVTALSTGIKDRRALYSSLVTVAVGMALYYPLQYIYVGASVWTILVLAVVAVGVGVLVGWLFRGPDRWRSARTAAITAVGLGFIFVIDRAMGSWQVYATSSYVNNRPIATIGSSTPQLDGDFWISMLDTYSHLLLPTLCLVLVSLASYSRYSRSSTLEVMNQDYIRTARAKGLTERTVVMRHAFRNTLIPVTTLLTLDIGALIGGAVITERVFGWSGMGAMFINGLYKVDVNSVMGFFLVTGATVIVFNIIADVLYSALDPRIRVS